MQKKLVGTKVTVESFMAWRKEFDAKRDYTMDTKKSKKSDAFEKKLTGKELFLQNSTLNESDLKFISTGMYLHIV